MTIGNDTIDYSILIDTLPSKTTRSEYEKLLYKFRLKGKWSDSKSNILENIISSGIKLDSEHLQDLVSIVRFTNKMNLRSFYMANISKDKSISNIYFELQLNSSEYILYSESLDKNDHLTDKSDVIKRISGDYYYYKIGRTRGFFFSD